MKKYSLRPLILTLAFTVTCILLNTQAYAQQPKQLSVKVQELDLFDEQRKRPVKVTVWYPAANECDKAKVCLSELYRPEQVAVFSHGAMGAAKGYNWIGYALASQGFVVAGVNHYGESWAYGQHNIDPSAVLEVWQRPLDISFVLDSLSEKQAHGESVFDRPLNWQNVTAIGHSSGAATVLGLAGASWNLKKALLYCAEVSIEQDKSCGYMRHTTQLPHKKPGLPAEFADNRIKRVIALDPALGHVTNSQSLKQIKIPVLLIASKQNDFLDYEQHAGFYLKHLVQPTAVVLKQGEGHFVYLDKCEHKYKAMGVSICEDRKEVDRKKGASKSLSTPFCFCLPVIRGVQHSPLVLGFRLTI